MDLIKLFNKMEIKIKCKTWLQLHIIRKVSSKILQAKPILKSILSKKKFIQKVIYHNSLLNPSE